MDRAGVKGRTSLIVRYVVSIASVALITGLRVAADRWLGNHHPYTFFFAAIAVSAWYSGFWPSVLAIVLSYLAADWFFVPPRYALDFHSYGLDDFLSLGGFLLSGLVIAFTTRALEIAKERAEQKQLELAREIVERERVQRDLERAQEALRHHTSTLEERVEERTAILRQTIHSLEAVCYHIAHDLRAPLRAMQGFTTLLVKDYAPHLDQTGEDYARRVGGAAHRMDRLIQSLLDYGRLGHQQFSISKVSLDAQLDAVLAALAGRGITKEAKIEIDRPLPPIRGNPILIEQVLSHLLSNALKFIRKGTAPRVHIKAEKRNEMVRLWIEDNGIGIAPEYRDKIFQVFERLQPDEIHPGTGMGLAIVAKAVQRMKGAVGVESELNHGSRFWVELPLAE